MLEEALPTRRGVCDKIHDLFKQVRQL